MIRELSNTVGKKVRFKVGEQDYIGTVSEIIPDDDCLVMFVGHGDNETRVTLRIDAIDAILQFLN